MTTPNPEKNGNSFPPKIMGQFAPDEDNGRWQGPYVFCPEQWSIAYDKPGDSWKPYDGELREVVFISIDEHEAVVADRDKKNEALHNLLDKIQASGRRGSDE